MGKGKGEYACRPELALKDPALDAISVGKSSRAKYTYELLSAAGGFPAKDLLRDLANPNNYISEEKIDSPSMIHNAMMRWTPSSYPGWAGHDRSDEVVGNELFYAIALEGDRRAKHTFYYIDRTVKGEWTLSAGELLADWYQLPRNRDGNLDPGQLPSALQRSLKHQRGPMLKSLRSTPIHTLALADLSRPAPKLNLSDERLAHPLLQLMISRQDPDSAGGRILFHRISAALRMLDMSDSDLVSESQRLSAAERQDLLLAVALAKPMPYPSELPAGVEHYLEQDQIKRIRELFSEIRTVRSTDGFPMLNPSSRVGKMLSDVQQSWLAGEWGGLGAIQFFAENEDKVFQLEYLQEWAARAKWYSNLGKRYYGRKSKKRETYYRNLHGLAKGIATPKKPTYRGSLEFKK